MKNLNEAEERLGSWMAAALDDPKVCDEMKSDINEWFREINLRELPTGWQTIETAPKHGEPIDIWGRHGRHTDCVFGKPTYAYGVHWIFQSDYDSDGPVFDIVPDPSHWMPLPAPPA